VAAVTARKIEQMRARAIQEYILTTPGVSFTDAGGGRESFTVRGVGSLGVGSTTAYYIDETPLGTDLRLFDIDRVEVLRGPQGTLYGVSSMGGALRTVTRKPDPGALEARFDGSVNQVAHGGVGGDANLAVNLPLAKDRLALRLVAYDEKRSGYIDNYRVDRSVTPPVLGPLVEKDVGDAEFKGGRIMLRWIASPRTTLDATLYYQADEYDALGSEDQDLGKLRQARGFNEAYATRTTQANLTLRHRFEHAELVSSTTYMRAKYDTSRDVTDLYGPFLPFFNITLGLGNGGATSGLKPVRLDEDYLFTGFTQEVRLASTGTGRLNWVMGAFYNDNNVTGLQTLAAPGAATVFGAFTPNDAVLRFRPNQPSGEASVFAEASYQVTPRLKATLGTRRYQLKNSFDQTVVGLFNANVAEVLAGDTSSVSEPVSDKGSAQESGFTYKAVLSFQATPNLLVYGGATSGYRPGGPNAYVPPGQTPTPTRQYTSDKLWQYELGVKSSWFGNRLTANAALFDIEWTDIQTAVATNAGFSFFINAGDARSRGAELELQARPVRGLELGAAVTVLDARFGSSFPSLNVKPGDRLPNIPNLQVNLNGRYAWPVAGRWSGYVYGSASHVGGRVNRAGDSLNMPAYDQVDGRIGLDRGDWDLSLFVSNLTDARAPIGYENGLGADRTQYIQPRTVGVALRADF
jgi:iron complex outermembrane receptor protein